MRILPLVFLVFAVQANAQSACGLQTDIALEQRITNTLRWTTASEQDNFAYDVYRGDSEEGSFARINPSPVPGNGTTDETHNYSYVDSEIDPCKSYWYYVESISTSGQRERFTPIFKAPPKRGPNAPTPTPTPASSTQ